MGVLSFRSRAAGGCPVLSGRCFRGIRVEPTDRPDASDSERARVRIAVVGKFTSGRGRQQRCGSAHGGALLDGHGRWFPLVADLPQGALAFRVSMPGQVAVFQRGPLTLRPRARQSEPSSAPNP
jgi:hypothetical protein